MTVRYRGSPIKRNCEKGKIRVKWRFILIFQWSLNSGKEESSRCENSATKANHSSKDSIRAIPEETISLETVKGSFSCYKTKILGAVSIKALSWYVWYIERSLKFNRRVKARSSKTFLKLSYLIKTCIERISILFPWRE